MAESHSAISKNSHFPAGIICISLLQLGQGKPAIPAFVAQATLFEAGYVARHHIYYQAPNIHPMSSPSVSFPQLKSPC